MNNDTTTLTPASPTVPVISRGSAGRRAALMISSLLLLSFFYFLFSTGRVRTMDEVSAAFQVESLARHGTTAIPQAVDAKLFYGTIDRFGRPESPYPPGQAVAMLPWYAVGQFFGHHLPGVGIGQRDVLSDFFLTGESAFFSALAVILAFWIFLNLGISMNTSLAAAAILALATPLAAYSGWLFSEPLAAALLIGAAAILFSGSQDIRISLARAIAAGALLVASVWVRPTHVIVVPVFLAAILIRTKERQWGAVAALATAACVGVALLLWRNSHLYGSIFEFGYPSAAEGGKALNTFETPLTTGLLGFLISPGKSIFLFCPPALLALAGLPRLWRRDRGLAVLAGASPLVYLLFFSTYTQWEGGYCYGPRYMVPSLALLGLAIGPALETPSRNIRSLALAVAIAGFAVQVLGTTMSFLEADVAGGYYDSIYNYRISFSPIAMHIHLLVHYINSETAPIGRGFDKWWVFLSRAGVSSGAIATLAAIILVGSVIAAWGFHKEYRKAIS